MPNLNFGQIRSLLKYIDKEEERDDEYQGSVLRNDFELQKSIDVLQNERWPVSDIIEYIV